MFVTGICSKRHHVDPAQYSDPFGVDDPCPRALHQKIMQFLQSGTGLQAMMKRYRETSLPLEERIDWYADLNGKEYRKWTRSLFRNC
jgi:hypothetical protein